MVELFPCAKFVVEHLLPQHEPVMNVLAGFRGINPVRHNAERITGVAACSAIIFVAVHLLNLLLQFEEVRLLADYPNQEWKFRVVNRNFFKTDSCTSGGELDGAAQTSLGVPGIHVCR